MREPVVSQISGLVADRLDDEREDRDGQDERREQQVELRDHPDGHAAPDDGKAPVLGLLVGLRLGLVLRVELFAGHAPVRERRARTERRVGSWNSRLIRTEAIFTAPSEHHEGDDGTEKDQQSAVRHGASLNWWEPQSATRRGDVSVAAIKTRFAGVEAVAYGTALFHQGEGSGPMATAPGAG